MDNEKPLARLLVVDDESDIVLVLKLGLIKYGFLVDAFPSRRSTPEIQIRRKGLRQMNSQGDYWFSQL